MTFSVERVRADFPLLNREVNGQPLAYLDSAASAQKPEAVINAEAEFYRHGYAAVHRRWACNCRCRRRRIRVWCSEGVNSCEMQSDQLICELRERCPKLSRLPTENRPPSSSGLGRRPFKAVARVRIP